MRILSLAKRKRRSVDSRKDQARHRRIWIRRCAYSYQGRIKNQRWFDVQRAVIAKRGSAPTIPANCPVGDSQSNRQVENAINKVRNMVKNNPFRFGVKVERQSDT